MSVPTKNLDAVTELEHIYGPDGELTATVHLDPGVRLNDIPVTLAVDGEILEHWRGWLMSAVDKRTNRIVAGAVGARAPNGAQFVLAQLSEPRDGDTVTGTVGELIDHVAPMRNQG